MKKQITLITIIIMLISICGRSQTLYNTTWSVYDTSNILFFYFHFGTDTLSMSPDNILYTPLATFQENVDSVTFIDLPGSDCADTGRYTFVLQDDTLKFTLINDTCLNRRNVLINFHWVSFITGIHTVNPLATIQLFPNPSNGIFSIKSEKSLVLGTRIEIVNLLGDKVFSLEISFEKTEIDLCSLPKGIYCYQIKSEKGMFKSGKIIID